MKAAVLLAAFLSGSAGGEAPPKECAAVFSQTAAEVVFAKIRAQAGADGCTLEDLHTERSRMEIVWKKEGTGLFPAIVLEPRECAKGARDGSLNLAVFVPEEVARECPDAVGAVALAERALDPTEVTAEASFGLGTAKLAWGLVALVLLGAAVIAAQALRRGVPSAHDPEGDGPRREP